MPTQNPPIGHLKKQAFETVKVSPKIAVIRSALKVQTPVGAQVVQQPTVQPTQVLTGCAVYRSLVDQYAWNTTIAMAVMNAESGCNPAGPPSSTCDYGLMQINCIHGDMVDGNLDRLFDPATNIAVAYRIYCARGWSAWTTFSSGRYLKYL